ncbi:MAG: hypothetical protein JWO50_499 [Candidatus Kaiserbacteria bacterium]|nr:hypothetical protein [Candidatus Kaiserbacteria bacterium]
METSHNNVEQLKKTNVVRGTPRVLPVLQNGVPFVKQGRTRAQKNVLKRDREMSAQISRIMMYLKNEDVV